MALTPKQDRLNRALDEPLKGPALVEFTARLEADPEEALLYAQLRRVDELFRQPPMVAPAPDLASKVMARIEAGEHLAYAPRRRWSVLLWGLALATLLAIPVVLFVALLVVPALTQPGALTSFGAGLIQIAGSLGGGLENLLQFLNDLLVTYPIAPALTLTAIPLTMLWVWMVWYFRQQNRPETVFIKVEVACNYEFIDFPAVPN